MDMVADGFLTTLEKSLKEGKVTMAEIDKACRRILEAKYKLGLFDDPYKYCDASRVKKDIFTAENRTVARKIATETFVLLKNENNLLPLQRKGRSWWRRQRTGRRWSSRHRRKWTCARPRRSYGPWR